MRTAVHAMPRIGEGRALKWALERYWAGKVSEQELQSVASGIRRSNWQALDSRGIGFIPSNDFSLYDHVLDAALAVGLIPERFQNDRVAELDRYFVMARGGERDGRPVAPLDLTKWFDTNYHHLVPEIGPETRFRPNPRKAKSELGEAAALGIPTMPVLLGPLTLLLRSAPTSSGLEVLSVSEQLAEAYAALLEQLADQAEWVRFDEPALVEDRTERELDALRRMYRRICATPGRPRLAISTYFGHLQGALPVLRDLRVEGVGLDFCRGRRNLSLLRDAGGVGDKLLFAGVVDGRNVWINDIATSLELIEQLAELCQEVVISTSCSLIHVPRSLATETTLDANVRSWMAFAEEKVDELVLLARGFAEGRGAIADAIQDNQRVLASRRESSEVVDDGVRRALREAAVDPRRSSSLEDRAQAQRVRLGLPVLPTTTIGSFPQTSELRASRASWRTGKLSDDEYRDRIRSEIERALSVQEELGIDVLVHGEPERDDMVRYFADRLTGFVVPQDGWVQSYGSRYVRPPVIFGDIGRPAPITTDWMQYAQSRTTKPMKGMLTGPVTMLRWSFVRDDQPEADTAAQLALAIREEVADLQAAGIAIIQVDEPALREGFPLRRHERDEYLAWATRAFRLVSSAALPDTQVHTHMCYAQLGDVVGVLADLDIDVVSLEAARSQMRLIGELEHASYRGGVGPGVYDVHSPRIPDVWEIESLLRRAVETVGAERLWVNPDCGLKTRRYGETVEALRNMVEAARRVRSTESLAASGD